MEVSDRILVTGGNGLLGRAIVEQLNVAGYANVYAPSRYDLNCLDSHSVAKWLNAYRPTYVFHLASLVFGLQGNLDNQLGAIHENTKIAQEFFKICADIKVKKIFYSGTVAAYPYPYVRLPLAEEDFWSGKPHAGEYGYAIAKRHALAYLEILSKVANIDFCYGIFTNLYGVHDKFDVYHGHVIPSLVAKTVAAVKSDDPTLEVWGRPDTVRDFLYVDDAAKAAIACMRLYSGVINIASGRASTMSEVVNAICLAATRQLNINWNGSAPIGIPTRSVDVGRLRSIGFRPSVSLNDGIKKTINWYLQNENLVRK